DVCHADAFHPLPHRSDRWVVVAIRCHSSAGADCRHHFVERVYAMRIGTMLKDIIASMFKKNSTQHYPFEKNPTPERIRGNLYYNPSACTGCCLGVKECPSKAIELVTTDRATKRFVLKYHMDRCVYCGQCAINCKFK